jgi:hypothetical protein
MRAQRTALRLISNPRRADTRPANVPSIRVITAPGMGGATRDARTGIAARSATSRIRPLPHVRSPQISTSPHWGVRRKEIPQEPCGTLRSPTIPWSATAALPNRPIPPLTSEVDEREPRFRRGSRSGKSHPRAWDCRSSSLPHGSPYLYRLSARSLTAVPSIGVRAAPPGRSCVRAWFAGDLGTTRPA